MGLIRLGTVEKILLGLPKSKKLPDFSNQRDTVFIIGNIIVVIPTGGIYIDHLGDILESQLGMSWWMIDYLYGQNGINH
tara:strand:+ start:117 stop:353 length:237 start_codon:yes stop_codon:yes gene_type:complete